MIAAGIIADAACLGLYCPVEIVVQRLQLPGRYNDLAHVLRDMWKEEGARTFYRGFGATVITSAVSSGVWWMAYENLKKVSRYDRSEEMYIGIYIYIPFSCTVSPQPGFCNDITRWATGSSAISRGHAN